MPIYHALGRLPAKRHVVFRSAQGALYTEELIGNKGFVGPSSLLYHIAQPTQVVATRLLDDTVDGNRFGHLGSGMAAGAATAFSRAARSSDFIR